MKLKLKNPIFLGLSTVLAATSLTSCSLFQSKTWSWETSTNKNTEINYCLLIGQNDHSDSIERTRSTRKALGTYDEEATKKVKNNANLANPKDGTIKLTNNETYGYGEASFTVKELEHMEQKSMAGATWDPITANDTAGTWCCKHNKKITFFVSNNDSMAEGATWATNWISNLPIFGYDANTTTLKKIKEGIITGTVDQNASVQTAAALMIIRNMLDDKAASASDFGKESYNPLHTGFKNSPTGEETEGSIFGNVDLSLITSNSHWSYGSDRALLIASTAIDNNPIDGNIDDYVKEDGTIKGPSDLYGLFNKIKKPSQETTKFNICHTYNNKAEVYLTATMRPYFKIYADLLNLNLDTVEGDGVDEGVIFNQLEARDPNKIDAYLINMVKTTDTTSYISKIAPMAAKKEGKSLPSEGWENFEDRLDTPVVFWNRQPQDDSGNVDTASMNNKFFKYTYFVGVDAAYGGDKQGEMIRKFIGQQYVSYKKDHR